jgi:hypothetical protein
MKGCSGHGLSVRLRETRIFISRPVFQLVIPLCTQMFYATILDIPRELRCTLAFNMYDVFWIGLCSLLHVISCHYTDKYGAGIAQSV